MEYEPHELCKSFANLSQTEAEQLASDIKANGQQDPVWLYEGKILDGKNRYNACLAAGVTPQFEEFLGNRQQAVAFVVSKNILRRHMRPGERAKFGAALATGTHGGDHTSEQVAILPLAPLKTQAYVAKDLGISPRTLRNAKTAAAAAAANQNPPPAVEPGSKPPEKPADPLDLAKIEGKRLRDLASRIHDIGEEICVLCQKPIGAHLSWNYIEARVQELKSALRLAAPYGQCPYCYSGVNGCRACRGQGWVPKVQFKQAPESMSARARKL